MNYCSRASSLGGEFTTAKNISNSNDIDVNAKVAFMEQAVFKKPARRYFCTLEIDPALYNTFQKKAKMFQVEIITKPVR